MWIAHFCVFICCYKICLRNDILDIYILILVSKIYQCFFVIYIFEGFQNQRLGSESSNG